MVEEKMSPEESPQYTYSASNNYDQLDERKSGMWKVVEEDGERVAVVWADMDNGGGVIWSNQTQMVEELYRYFADMKELGYQAGAAYALVDTMVPGVTYVDEDAGPLSGAVTAYENKSTDRLENPDDSEKTDG